MKLPAPISFDWDKGNIDKNWVKHKVYFRETEEVFFNKPLKIFPDIKHFENEKRFVALGVTDKKRKLTIIFTIREKKLRAISASDQNKKKKGGYMKKSKSIPKFRNEDEERNFWDKADIVDYFDIDNPIELDLTKLKPSTESISLRLPAYLLARIKEIANSRDVPYQSLIKIFLAERVERELKNP